LQARNKNFIAFFLSLVLHFVVTSFHKEYNNQQ